MTTLIPRLLEASITARGGASRAPDHPGAVDADIFHHDERLGSCTLLPDVLGLLSTWGDSIDCWADEDLQIAIFVDSWPVWAITSAVRVAAAQED